MQFLRYVSFNRVHSVLRCRDGRKGEEIASLEQLGLPEKGLSEGHVDAEGASIHFARQQCLGSISSPFILHPVGVQFRIVRIRLDLEDEVVTEVEAAGRPQQRKDVFGGTDHPQVDVPGRSCACKSHFEDQSPLQDHGVAEFSEDPGEKAIEDDKLS